MIHNLQLKDLFIGKTDAKNELIDNNDKTKELFCNSFLIPENININDFYEGRRYYITGLKGTGKTALLHYIDLKMREKTNYQSSFILFKSSFTEDDKAAFTSAANAACAVKNTDNDDFEDYINVWHWFLHRQIVLNSQKSEVCCFKNDTNWQKYRNCVLSPKLGNDEAGITTLFPRLKRGNIEIGADVEFLKGKLGLEFEWENEPKKIVKFSHLVRQVNELYKKLTPSDVKLFLYIDELELTLTKQKQYQKDIKLIRDLIVAINHFNTLSKQYNYNIYTISAIRSEVLTAINAIGKEINKPIIDFGVNLKWQLYGGNIDNHPLIKIINKKIMATELYYNLPVSSEDEVWEKYFPSQINNQPIKEYILHRTWYRPRDIVRLLNIAIQQFPNESKFSHTVFDAINKEYSTQSWIEQTEELASIYSPNEIEGIKKMLTALKSPFTMHQITDKCEKGRKVYSALDDLLRKYKIGDLLSHLYNVGIIGNTGEKIRYSFRGDDELIIENMMKIHDSLWNYLSIEYRKPSY